MQGLFYRTLAFSSKLADIRVIAVPDKAALDVWYVRSASLALDLEILARTVTMVSSEKVYAIAIRRAWARVAAEQYM